MVSYRSSDAAWVWSRQSRPHVRLRLFCFPYAGGGASIFRTWPANLPDSIEVCPVQLPGREGRMNEAPFTSLSLLLQTLARILRPQLDMPFAFFGHSMGALISFELTRLLRAQSNPSPHYLFVSAHRAPQRSSLVSPVCHLPEAEFLDQIRHLQGTPEEILRNPELMQLLLPTLRADFELCETYSYRDEEVLDCPISAFGGTLDDEITSEDLNAWGVQTRRAFQVRMFSGNHFFIRSAQKPLLQAIAQDLSQLLIVLEHDKGGRS